MSWLSGLLKGVGTYALTGSTAGAAASFFTNSFLAGTGVGMLDNLTGRSLSYGVNSAWNGNFGYGGFYGNNQPMNYDVFNMYSNYSSYGFGNSGYASYGW